MFKFGIIVVLQVSRLLLPAFTQADVWLKTEIKCAAMLVSTHILEACSLVS